MLKATKVSLTGYYRFVCNVCNLLPLSWLLFFEGYTAGRWRYVLSFVITNSDWLGVGKSG